MDLLINQPILNFISFLIGVAGFLFAIVEMVRAGSFKRVAKSWGMSSVRKLEHLKQDLARLDQRIAKMELTEWRNATNEVKAEIHNHSIKIEEIADDLKELFNFLKKERVGLRQILRKASEKAIQ